jgi:pimeloyl-ACP methyl ester carboxylesterase
MSTDNDSSQPPPCPEEPIKSTSTTGQTLLLPNGHTLGYATYGSPIGHPLFFPHGYPSSRLEGIWLHQAAQTLNIHIISPDRPGIGLSTRSPTRTLLEFPSLISFLATYLRLSSFSILGSSGGGPYALACAYKLKDDRRLRCVGVVAGFGPPNLGFEGMGWGNRLLLRGLQWWPSAVHKLMEWTLMRAAQNPDSSVLRDEWKKAVSRMTGRDREVFEKDSKEGGGSGEIFEACVEGAREHWRQGKGGFVDDGRVVMSPWGFELEDVEFEGVRLFYGTKDTNTPVQMGRVMAGRLRNATLNEYEGETHTSIVDHIEEILRDLCLTEAGKKGNEE